MSASGHPVSSSRGPHSLAKDMLSTATIIPGQTTTVDARQSMLSCDGDLDSGILGAGEPLAAKPPIPRNDQSEKQLRDVLSSEIGIPVMLARLKQSIASAKELAHFLRKRAILEEDHATGVRKLCRATQENLHRPDQREGSFLSACDEMMAINERLADNGLHYANSLHQMHNDLIELCEVAERHRKGWKATGMSAEERVAEFEQATKKSKAKYDALVEEYDRARTGDTRSGGKMSLFKMSKSLAQQEEDLLRKVQGADQAYFGQTQALQSERTKLLTTTRPETVKALQELITETDTVVALQLQKLSTFCEKYILSDGLVIRPVGNGDIKNQKYRGLREVAAIVDNNMDLTNYILAHHSRVQPDHGPTPYEQHPILTGFKNPLQPSLGTNTVSHHPHGILDIDANKPAMNTRNAEGTQPLLHRLPDGLQNRDAIEQQLSTGHSPQAATYRLPVGNQAPSLAAHQQFSPQPPLLHHHDQSSLDPKPHHIISQLQFPPNSVTQSGHKNHDLHHSSTINVAITSSESSQGPPQLGALPFQSDLSTKLPSSTYPSQTTDGDTHQDRITSQPTPPAPSVEDQIYHTPTTKSFQHTQTAPSLIPSTCDLNLPNSNNTTEPDQSMPLSANPPSGGPNLPSGAPPLQTPGKMFHLSLAALYERDNNPVPLVVNQCIQAIELFGLNVEGIYRQSGSINHIASMKLLFDKEPHNSALDFRRPDNFNHDINSVAGLLKQFFRDLPDPLLTQARYQEFISAAKKDDDIVRRDMLHAIINGLDDPNYASLRALSLHLYRVSANKAVTRMDPHNLAVIFGPTLMGTNNNLADSGWQVRVIETILVNTHQIFDED